MSPGRFIAFYGAANNIVTKYGQDTIRISVAISVYEGGEVMARVLLYLMVIR